MKLRSLLSGLAIACLALLVTASAGLYWLLGQSPLNLLAGGVETYPQAAIFVPRAATLMVSLLANPKRIAALTQLETPLAQRHRAYREFQQLQANLLAATGLDYRQDIQPWLGEEMTLAVTDIDYDRDESNGLQPGYLLVTEAKNPQLAKEFLQSSFAQVALKGTTDLVFENYKGVNIVFQRPLLPVVVSQTKLFASAVVGNYVLFANYPQVLKQAINNVQAPNLSLTEAVWYQKALKTVTQPRIGLIFANLPALSAWINQQPLTDNSEIEQMLTVTMSLKPGGLTAQTALIGFNQADSPPLLSAPVQALNYQPQNAILSVASRDLNSFWQKIETGLQPDSPIAQLLTQTLAKIEVPLGINLPQDIFSWVTGEYALAWLYSPEKRKLDWLFVAEKTPAAQAGITKLDELAVKRGLNVNTFSLNGKTAKSWLKFSTATEDNSLSLKTQIQGVHTSLENYEILATSIEALAKAINAPQQSLLKSEKFQKAITALPARNDGYFYLDWSEGKVVLEKKFPLIRVIELAAQPIFNHLRSLTLSSQGSKDGVTKAAVYFNWLD